MKKLLVCMAVFLLLCAPALAETVAIPLADGQLVFDAFPDGHVLTNETSASVFNRLGMSQRETMAYLEAEGVSAILLDEDWGCETLLSVQENDYPAFVTFSEAVREQVCDSFRENYEQYGYQVHHVTMLDKGVFTFISAYITLEYADGTVEKRIVYQTSFEGYDVLVTMFIFAEDPEAYMRLADQLVSSMRYETNPGKVTLSLRGAEISLSVPEGLMVHSEAAAAGVTLPETPNGEVVGCTGAGEWFILWTLDENASGDMDRLSDAGVRALYQARAKNKKASGCTVTAAEDHPDSRQRYIRIGYHFSDENGDIWYAEEYYTKQAGWGASVTAYSCGAPLPEEVQTMLANIVDSQMVDVKE